MLLLDRMSLYGIYATKNEDNNKELRLCYQQSTFMSDRELALTRSAFNAHVAHPTGKKTIKKNVISNREGSFISSGN